MGKRSTQAQAAAAAAATGTSIFSRQRKVAAPGKADQHDYQQDHEDHLSLNLKKTKVNSLRKMNKKRTGVMKQMLEKFPKPDRSNNNELPAQAAADDHHHHHQEEEPIYESRKLLIRQMQGMIAKEVLKDRKRQRGSDTVGKLYT